MGKPATIRYPLPFGTSHLEMLVSEQANEPPNSLHFSALWHVGNRIGSRCNEMNYI